MKNLLFTLLIISLTFSVYAQPEKGNLVLGGTFSSLTYSGTKGYNLISFNIYPDIGKFISKRTMIGASPDLYLSYYGGGLRGDVGLRIFAKTYLTNDFDKKGLPFVATNIGLARAFSLNLPSLSVGLGYDIYLNNNFAINPSLNVTFYESSYYANIGVSSHYIFKQSNEKVLNKEAKESKEPSDFLKLSYRIVRNATYIIGGYFLVDRIF